MSDMKRYELRVSRVVLRRLSRWALIYESRRRCCFSLLIARANAFPGVLLQLLGSTSEMDP